VNESPEQQRAEHIRKAQECAVRICNLLMTFGGTGSERFSVAQIILTAFPAPAPEVPFFQKAAAELEPKL
jgi:hypothetical protein